MNLAKSYELTERLSDFTRVSSEIAARRGMDDMVRLRQVEMATVDGRIDVAQQWFFTVVAGVHDHDLARDAVFNAFVKLAETERH